jgi:hypothetical protein
MSKKSSTEEKQNSSKLGISIPSGAKILLDSLAMLKNSSQAEILISGMLHVLDSSSNSQKEAINGMIKAAGFTLRDLKKSVAHLEGQGTGDESDGALARTNRIVDLQTRMVNAADVAIDSLAN